MKLSLFFVVITLLALGFWLLAFSAPVFAFHGLPGDTSHKQIVPVCGGSVDGRDIQACTVCDIFVLIQSVLGFLVWFITLPLAGLMFAFGGVLLVLPYLGASTKMHDRGKAVLTQAVVGILIVFVAWLAIDTIMKVAGANALQAEGSSFKFGPWNEIICEAPEITAVTPPPVAAAVTPPQDAAAGDTIAKVLVANNIEDFQPDSDGDCYGSNGKVGPQTNITEAAEGKPITVCQSGCSKTTNIMCTSNSSVQLNPTMLAQTQVLLNDPKYKDKVKIESLATGDHSSVSVHYAGDGADIVKTSSDTTYADIRSFMETLGGNSAKCHDKNGEIKCSQATHVHVGY